MTIIQALTQLSNAGAVFVATNGNVFDFDDEIGELARAAEPDTGDYVVDGDRIVAINAEGYRESVPVYTAIRCRCTGCGCSEYASTTDDACELVCDECADYYTDDDGTVVCSREQGDDVCRHCGDAIEWGGIQTSEPGVANVREGRCSCRAWRQTERGGHWELSEGPEEEVEDEEDLRDEYDLLAEIRHGSEEEVGS